MKLNRFGSIFFVLTLLVGVMVGCEDDSAGDNLTNKDYISLGEKVEAVVITQGQTATVEGKVYASHTSNADRVVSLRVITESVYNTETGTDQVPVTTIDQDDYTVPATVTIPAGSLEGTFSVTITDVNLDYNGKKLVVGIVPSTNWEIAQRTIGNKDLGTFEVLDKRLEITATRRCTENSLRVEVVTDNYGAETTWELYDSNFSYVDGIDGPVGPYTNGVLGVQDTRSFCLSAGEYTLVVYDSEGDGMNDGTNQGYVRLYTVDEDGNETEIYRTATFATDDIYTFTLN
ncbi:hypothetical protein GR160_11770 [Flavobacterium sp. Sd200]|uniref:DUF1735 domain-containing protein n=1 Tax=Flavobacterium sp. Sd200 TaxID=2692211 RepID=UPI00136EFACD|nr:DUF1735 domain-containing protein [Flavobacterium sp. Sd200]MXN91901.1 hypothetical protein [Flavobacterium sp. Sd200]